MKLFDGKRLAEIAAQTPASRDRYVDFLRALSIMVVVIGHWISAVVIRDPDGGIRVCNAVGIIPGMWVITWLLQVMPIFFFVGGFSNFVTFDAFRRRGDSLLKFYRTRLVRLLKPTVVFLLVVVIISVILILTLKDWQRYLRVSIGVIGPLWFLAVYIIVMLAMPFMRYLHKLSGVFILLVLFIFSITVDILHFWFKVPIINWLNVVFIWFFIHQLGFFYADGSLLRMPRWFFSVGALASFGMLVFLTNIGVYPRSMVGTGFEKTSNMNPPTICIIFLGLWLIGLFMFLRDFFSSWLSRQKPWMTVILANTMIMTLYLWHLTAFALAFLILSRIGLGISIDNLTLFWLERPLWIVVPGIILLGLLAIFRRFERA